MYSGAAGLRAHQTQMDVIGNNIANINTAGFKASRAEFQEALSQTLQNGTGSAGGVGGTDPVQIGMGVSVGKISTDPTQGSLQYTGRSLDVGIEGKGFLALSDGNVQHYTRDGALSVDGDGNLVSAGSGLKVMGWNVDPATGAADTTGTLVPIKLPSSQATVARQTGKVSFAGNLDSSLAEGQSVQTTYNIYDSLGKSHPLTVTFTRTANPGEWAWSAALPEAGAGGTPTTGTLAFGTDGKITAGGDATASITLPNPNGANPTLSVKMDLGTLTSLAGSGTSTVTPTAQDGLPPGTLTGYGIGQDGTINGTFSNGITQAVARIALADFSNPGGLLNSGGNLLSTSPNSGLPQFGAPDTGGRGRLSPGSIEMSNVDLSKEFTSMIVAQRGFQANSKIITTSDEMLQDLIGLKR
jgi:flagellar hook protein FlgE